MQIKNFLFHCVSDTIDPIYPPLPIQKFDTLIKYLSQNYYIRTIEDIVENKELKITKKLATISFDDGYKDVINNALPILKKYNCCASVYLPTQFINAEGNHLIWTQELGIRILNTHKRKITLDSSALPEKLRVFDISDIESKAKAGISLKNFIKTISHSDRERILTEIRCQLDDVRIPSLMMNWQDIHELKKEGIKIGSHSVSHHLLDKLPNEEHLFYELNESRETIFKHTGEYPISIAYPNGNYNNSVVKIAKAVGYKMGLALKEKAYDSEKDENFEIPRIQLFDESWVKTYLRINGIITYAKQIIRKGK